jgi:electron transport complex protein RnfB
MPDDEKAIPRRDFLRSGVRGACLVGLGGAVGLLATRSRAGELVWQLDPEKCTQCGNCATYCVLKPSAVKCVHAYALCGYCELCTGYFEPEPNELNTAAENQLCPVAAIKRTYVEDPYYQYDIDESLCIGCGKCMEGCRAFGNGSLYIQVRHDLCLNCNQCSIAAACPANAFRRVPADQPYLHPKGYTPTPQGDQKKP